MKSEAILNVLLTALHPVGGIRTYFRYVYSEPAFKDVNLTLLAPDEGFDDFLREYLPDNRITLIPTNNNKDFLFKINKSLKSGDFDIVHSHGFSAAVIGVFANFFPNVIHIMTGHDVFNSTQFKGFKGGFKKRFLSFAFSRLNIIHTISNDAQSNFVEFFPEINKSRFYSILNGVDTQLFANGVANNLRNDISALPEQPVIGFFGRFMAQKGFRVLVDAIKDIVENNKLSCSPLIATFGWGGFIREDFQYIEDLGLSKYFIQMEATNDMPANLKSVDLVVIPSRWEACPLLPMEALSAGVPIVGTNCLGLREILKDTPADVIQIDDVEALSQSIVDNLNNSKKEQFLAYQSAAVRRYSVESTAMKLKDLYENSVLR